MALAVAALADGVLKPRTVGGCGVLVKPLSKLLG